MGMGEHRSKTFHTGANPSLGSAGRYILAGNLPGVEFSSVAQAYALIRLLRNFDLGYRVTGYEANPPLPRPLVKKAFELQPRGTSVDIVGLSNITNLARIAQEAAQNGFKRIRVFEPHQAWMEILDSYMNNVMRLTSEQNKDTAIFMLKGKQTFLYSGGQKDTIDLGDKTLAIEFIQSTYEAKRGKIPGCPDITFVDQVFPHATDPVKLLEALKLGDPERLIVLRGYGKTYTPHRVRGGQRLQGVAKGDLNDGVWFPGTMPPNSLLVNDHANPLYRQETGVVFTGVDKRLNKNAFPGKSEKEDLGENNEYVVDSEKDSVHIPKGKTIMVRRKGRFPITRPIKDKTGDQKDAQLEGDVDVSFVWLNSENDALTLERVSPHDRKILVASYTLEDLIIRGEDIDPYKIIPFLPPRFYSTLRM